MELMCLTVNANATKLPLPHLCLLGLYIYLRLQPFKTSRSCVQNRLQQKTIWPYALAANYSDIWSTRFIVNFSKCTGHTENAFLGGHKYNANLA